MLSRTLLSPTLALQASVRRSQTCCPLLWPSSLAPAPPLVFPSWGVQCWWSPLQADPKSTQEQSRSEPREAPCCARVTSLPPSLGWKWEAVSRAGSSQNTGCAVGPEGSKQENAIEEAHVSVVCVSAKVQSRRRLQRTTEKFQRCYLPPQNKISPEGKKKKSCLQAGASQLSGWSTPMRGSAAGLATSATSEEAQNSSMPCSGLRPLHHLAALMSAMLLAVRGPVSL